MALNTGNGMRRVLAIALSAAVTFGMSGCTFNLPSVSSVKDDAAEQKVSNDYLLTPGTLTVALDEHAAPLAAKDGEGNLVGYQVDVASALAQNLGLKVAFVDSASASDALKGKADVFIGASHADESSDLEVKCNIMQDSTAVFGKPRSNSKVVSSKVLSKSTVGVQETSASQGALNKVGIKAKQKTYQSINDCFKGLASGEVQYEVCDAASGAYVACAYAGVSFMGTISAADTTGIAVPAKASGLAKAISTEFDSMSAGGLLDAIRTKWFGSLPSDLSQSQISGVTVSGSGDSSDSDSSSDSSSSGDSSDSDASSGSSSSDSKKSKGSDAAEDTSKTSTITDADINSL